MPSATDPSTISPADTPIASSSPATIPPAVDTTSSQDTAVANADGLTKRQRKKQRKKEKKALAREEAAKEQQLSLGKLAVAL